MKRRTYYVGHGAYTGRNRLAVCVGHMGALSELLRRGIRMRDAQHALQSANAGSHATASYYTRAASGLLIAVATVEVRAAQ